VCEDRLDAAVQERSTAAERAGVLPGAIERARASLADARAAAAQREQLGAALERARTRADAARALEDALPRLLTLQDDLRDARDRTASARERMHDVIARRLAGIAAELAGRLHDGEPCQVCGSIDHPRPAEAAAGAVTEDEHDRACAAFETETEALDRVRRQATDAEVEVESLRQLAAGLGAEQALAEARSTQDALTAADASARQVDTLRGRLDGLVEEQQRLATRLREVGASAAALEQALGHHRRSVTDITEEIAAATGTQPTDDQSVDDGIARLRRALAAVEAAGTAVTAYDEATARADQVRRQARAAVHDQGFDDLETARAAALPAEERARLASEVAARAEARSAATAVLEDPDVRALGDAEQPDPAAIGRALAAAEEAATATARGLHHAEDTLAALTAHDERLQVALDDWLPAQQESGRADAMARLVRGTGSDNHLQMRLSAYVLATRLDQVVDAANERLAHMRDQRYLLQRTGRAARRGSQAGLGLEVVDQWTGDVRDPGTLSGGETFVVSLSLALGLADVVSQEAGGNEIHTLFVDEGFGTLDADTLDDVMDRLDGLRAGGRTVGVVSHVTELRNRIPTQVHVDKHRTGSTIAVRTLVG
jgi:DNA repair protein SbcC/Rad50